MKPSLKKNVYHHIRGKLLSRELVPGSLISHRELAKEIGVSFTPVREAIGQLTNEGLLECHPNRGTFVPEFSREDLAELYDIREMHECHAVVKAADRISEADLAEMERLTDEMAEVAEEVKQNANPIWDTELADRWMVADAAFHMHVLRAAGNRRSLKIVRDMHMMSQIFGQRKYERSQDDLHTICDQHREIIEALRSRDGENASRVMSEHIQRGSRIALAAYDRNRFEREDGIMPSVTYPVELRERIQEIETKSNKEH